MTTSPTRRKRSRGGIETLPSGALRVMVYAGIDPVSGKRHYLREVIPAGPKAAAEAEKALRRLANQVDEKQNPRTSATLDQLLDRYLEALDVGISTKQMYTKYLEKHVCPFLVTPRWPRGAPSTRPNSTGSAATPPTPNSGPQPSMPRPSAGCAPSSPPRPNAATPSTPASSPSCTANSAPPITRSRSSARACPSTLPLLTRGDLVRWTPDLIGARLGACARQGIAEVLTDRRSGTGVRGSRRSRSARSCSAGSGADAVLCGLKITTTCSNGRVVVRWGYPRLRRSSTASCDQARPGSIRLKNKLRTCLRSVGVPA
jgi:hypothetical protein